MTRPRPRGIEALVDSLLVYLAQGRADAANQVQRERLRAEEARAICADKRDRLRAEYERDWLKANANQRRLL